MRKRKVLIVDDEKLLRWSLSQKIQEWNFDVAEAENGETALFKAEEEAPDLVMLDVKLPDKKGTDLLQELKNKNPEVPVIMMTAYGVIDDAVIAMRRGAYDFITKPIDDSKLKNTIKNALETASLKKEVAYYREREKKQFDPSQFVAQSKTMKQVFEMVRKIAESEASIILLQGESGTGKDLLAQTIHYLSRRDQSAYLAINCSAIPENLLESELFGYEKGAFTDAKQRKKGLVELAEAGTLFLDEISTLNLHLQAKLLRFLETQTFKRVGGLKDIEVDIRVIAATNQDLEIACEEGNFRKDLYYRLNVCPVFIPPLRERKSDIIPLAQQFISHYNSKFRKDITGLAPDVEKLFMEYGWPGNVRELKNAVERAMIFEEESLITTKNLPIPLGKSPMESSHNPPGKFATSGLSLEEMEKELLKEALKKANGNQSQAAKLLKITRDTLRYKIKKYGLNSKELSHSL
ncbi:MAG: sigma-54-dependent Fis family transcriptional regulator [Candidatus Aminicenantes bacterium]|nr:MAG: sigma-54-dependent Fis family transcriptional regulator [Candidatus Aminicenantes bacterium]